MIITIIIIISLLESLFISLFLPLLFERLYHLRWIPVRKSAMSIALTLSSFLTTNAFGSSPAKSSGIPITAASRTPECSSKIASNSAGATYINQNYQFNVIF